MKRIQKVLLAITAVMIGSTLLLSSCQNEDNVSPDNSKYAGAAIVETDSLDCSCIVNPADTIYTAEINRVANVNSHQLTLVNGSAPQGISPGHSVMKIKIIKTSQLNGVHRVGG